MLSISSKLKERWSNGYPVKIPGALALIQNIKFNPNVLYVQNNTINFLVVYVTTNLFFLL